MGKGIWTGYTGSMPITSSVLVTRDNYTTFFSLSNGTYKFNPNTDGWWVNTNSGVNSSTATTTLTIKSAATVKIEYDYGTEANYDKVTLTAGGTTILSEVSGAVTTGSKTVDLTANQTIVMTYAKDSSSHSNGDYAKFKFTIISTTTGNVTNVARKVKKPFIGVRNVVRTVKNGYIGVSNVARKFFGSIYNFYVNIDNNGGHTTELVTINKSFSGVDGDVWRFYLNTTGTQSGYTYRARAYVWVYVEEKAGKTMTVTAKREVTTSSYVDCDIGVHAKNGSLLENYKITSTSFSTKTITLPSNAYRVFIGINQSPTGTHETTLTVSSVTIDGEELI